MKMGRNNLYTTRNEKELLIKVKQVHHGWYMAISFSFLWHAIVEHLRAEPFSCFYRPYERFP
jgi:hypothetical protein